jgi:hypothetical protein
MYRVCIVESENIVSGRIDDRNFYCEVHTVLAIDFSP